MQVGRLWTQGKDAVWHAELYGIYDGVLRKTISICSRPDSTQRPISLPTFTGLSRLKADWKEGAREDAVSASEEKLDRRPEAARESQQNVNKTGLDLRHCNAVYAATFRGDFESFGCVPDLKDELTRARNNIISLDSRAASYLQRLPRMRD